MCRFGSSHCLPLLSSFSVAVSVPLAPSLTPHHNLCTHRQTAHRPADFYGRACPLLRVVQSPRCVQLFVTAWTAARQSCLSFTISWSLPTFTSIESVEEGMANQPSILAVRTPSVYCMLYEDFHSKMDPRVLIAWVNHLVLLQCNPIHSSVLNFITLIRPQLPFQWLWDVSSPHW